MSAPLMIVPTTQATFIFKQKRHSQVSTTPKILPKATTKVILKARSHGAATVAAMATLTIGFHFVRQQMTYYVMCRCRCHCHTEWVPNLFTCGTIAAATATAAAAAV